MGTIRPRESTGIRAGIWDDPLEDCPWCREVLPELNGGHWQRFLGIGGVIGEHHAADAARFMLPSDTGNKRMQAGGLGGMQHLDGTGTGSNIWC